MALLPAAGGAFALDPSRALTQYVQESWTHADGLPQDVVTALAQTADGYLWIGTEAGLVRFDGVRFTVYSTGTTDAWPDDIVTGLQAGRDGTLWVSTRGGVVALDGDEIRVYGVAEGLASEVVEAIFEDRGGRVWAGTKADLCLLEQGRFRPWRDRDGLGIRGVQWIGQARGGPVWFGLPGAVYELRRDRLVKHVTEAHRTLPRRSSYLVAADGTLWIGGSGLLDRLLDGEIATREIRAGGQPEFVSALALDRAGNLWIGTRGQRLLRIPPDAQREPEVLGGLPGAQIETLFEDREGSLWVGTRGAGLVRLRDGRVSVHGKPEGLPSEFIHTVFEDSGGRL